MRSELLHLLAGALAIAIVCLLTVAVVEPVPPPPDITITATSTPTSTPSATPRVTPSPRAGRTRPATVIRRTPHLQRPLDWASLAACESSNDPHAISPSGRYRGLLQFSLSSWQAVGMTGDPIDYPASVQLAAGRRLLRLQGRGAWPICGRRL